jgi:nucleoside transporter
VLFSAVSVPYNATSCQRCAQPVSHGEPGKPVEFSLHKEHAMEGGQSNVRSRLSAMMFLEFFIWASWYVPMGGYITNTLKFSGGQIGWLFATTALGAIIAPLFVGYVADRLFATERVLCVLHLVGGVCLILAAMATSFWLLMTLLMINTLCFMPTLALANSLAFRNIDDPDKFPRIALFGTIGWIVSGWIVGFLLGETREWFFYLAGVVGILMGGYSLTLPHTPPKGREEAGGDVFGFGAVRLLRESSFLIFVVSAFLIAIPATFYFVCCNAMLVETDRPVPTALMTLGQLTEIAVMFSMPWFIARFGLRRILALGMLAWMVRYLLFGTLSFPLILLGLLVHGFAYCFVFVGAYIYVDKRAPRDLRASAQSFIAFLMLGVGMFLGSKLGGYTMGGYPQTVPGIADTPSMSKLAEMVDADEDGQITSAELARIPAEGLELGGKKYAKQDLTGFFEKVDDQKEIRTKSDVRAAVQGEVRVTRSDWLEAQSHHWPPIWLWPAAAAAAIGAFFWLASRDEQPAAEAEEEAAAGAEEAAEEGEKDQEEPAAGEADQGSQPEGESAGQ